MRTDRPETAGGGARSGSGKGPGGYSYRGSELSAAEKRALVKQNKSAESMKNKDLDKFEKGRKNRAAKKVRDAAIKAKELKAAETKGKIKGAAATVGVGVGALAVAKNEKKKATEKPKTQASAAKPGSKKLTPEQAKLAKVVQRIGAIDRKKK